MLLAGVDVCALLVPHERPSPWLEYVFAGPAALAGRGLLYGREQLGWNLAEGASTPLSVAVLLGLMAFNVVCYALVGALAGLWWGKALERGQGRKQAVYLLNDPPSPNSNSRSSKE